MRALLRTPGSCLRDARATGGAGFDVARVPHVFVDPRRCVPMLLNDSLPTDWPTVVRELMVS